MSYLFADKPLASESRNGYPNVKFSLQNRDGEQICFSKRHGLHNAWAPILVVGGFESGTHNYSQP